MTTPQAVDRRPRIAAATLLGSGRALGWGLFNLVEGVIDHHILHIHHVIENENHLVWDLAFLASGVVLIGVGLALIRAGRNDTLTRGAVVA